MKTAARWLQALLMHEVWMRSNMILAAPLPSTFGGWEIGLSVSCLLGRNRTTDLSISGFTRNGPKVVENN